MSESKFESHCCRCASTVGDAAKVQPQRVDDGEKKYELYCPRCFVWTRANEVSEQGTHGKPRFNASQMCVAKCQFCEWVAVSFGARPGYGLMCGHCKKPGARKLRVDQSSFTPQEWEAIRHAQAETQKGRVFGVQSSVNPRATRRSRIVVP